MHPIRAVCLAHPILHDSVTQMAMQPCRWVRHFQRNVSSPVNNTRHISDITEFVYLCIYGLFNDAVSDLMKWRRTVE
jgi:hypothetical protein